MKYMIVTIIEAPDKEVVIELMKRVGTNSGEVNGKKWETIHFYAADPATGEIIIHKT